MGLLVSIIIPAYNSEKLIWQCVDSCVKQTYKDIEIIIIDDCSTDKTLEKVKIFNDDRIKFFRNENNIGTAFSRNKGIDKSSGDILSFLDSDDMLTNDSVERRIRFINKGIVFGSMYLIRGDKGEKYYNSRRNELRIKNSKLVGSGTALIKKEIIKKYGNFDTRLFFNEDREYWARLLVINKLPAIKLTNPVSYYRKHDNNKLSHSSIEERKKAGDDVIRIIGDHDIKSITRTEPIELINDTY